MSFSLVFENQEYDDKGPGKKGDGFFEGNQRKVAPQCKQNKKRKSMKKRSPDTSGDSGPGNGFMTTAQHIPEKKDKCSEIKAGRNFEKQNIQERQGFLLRIAR
jgi:hypothetical protein